MVNSPLIRPYLLGETWHWGGGTLDSHDTEFYVTYFTVTISSSRQVTRSGHSAGDVLEGTSNHLFPDGCKVDS